MPQWFLALWIAARDMVGSAVTSISSGVIGYVLAGANKCLILLDKDGIQPIDLAEDSIILRTTPQASPVSPGPGSIVIGSGSGVRVTASTSGKNICIGHTAYVNGSKLNIASATLIGNICRIDDTYSGLTSVGALGVGYGITMPAGRNVFVGAGLQHNVGTSAQRDLNYRVAAFGVNFTVGHAPSTAGYNAVGTMVANSGTVGTQRLSTNAAYGILDLFGTNNRITANSSGRGDVSLIGSSAQLNWNSLSNTWDGATELPSVMRLAKGRATGYTDVAARQAGIDIIAGDSINKSLILLGGGIERETSSQVNAANTAYQYALADWGKQLDATGANVTIPDNCSTYILTDPTAAEKNITVTLPASPIDGQLLVICLGADYGSVGIIAGGGRTVQGGLADGAMGNFLSLIYVASTTTWYRRG